MLYIFWFLHQTTTWRYELEKAKSCISFDSYIKPQLDSTGKVISERCISFDSYIKPQPLDAENRRVVVVYLLIPTSNHNWVRLRLVAYWLYIFWFLHQTTTFKHRWKEQQCCISFDSYIKPQLKGSSYMPTYVVYLLIPTSNHNHITTNEISFLLYIFWFLHQTTTADRLARKIKSCISFDSYIKPQLVC